MDAVLVTADEAIRRISVQYPPPRDFKTHLRVEPNARFYTANADLSLAPVAAYQTRYYLLERICSDSGLPVAIYREHI
jgi:hypothetical protein